MKDLDSRSLLSRTNKIRGCHAVYIHLGVAGTWQQLTDNFPQYTIIIVPATTFPVPALPLKPRMLDESTVRIDKLCRFSLKQYELNLNWSGTYSEWNDGGTNRVMISRKFPIRFRYSAGCGVSCGVDSELIRGQLGDGLTNIRGRNIVLYAPLVLIIRKHDHKYCYVRPIAHE